MYDRSKCVGASDAVHIQAGNWAELYDRKQSRDEPEYGLAAELGKILEPFNLELFKRQTGAQVHTSPAWQEDPFTFADNCWCTFLPDGLTYPGDKADDITADPIIPVEAKCINMMWQPANLLKKYMPQLQHAMRVMGAPYCWFSVIYLNIKYEYQKIPYDEPYADALFEKEKLFYWHLVEGIRPPEYLGKRKGWT